MQAITARKMALEKEHVPYTTISMERKTVEELFTGYCKYGRCGKAYTTIKKQDSLWKNHLKARFGSRFLNEISVAEMTDYLSFPCYTENRTYKYVESFLMLSTRRKSRESCRSTDSRSHHSHVKAVNTTPIKGK